MKPWKQFKVFYALFCSFLLMANIFYLPCFAGQHASIFSIPRNDELFLDTRINLQNDVVGTWSDALNNEELLNSRVFLFKIGINKSHEFLYFEQGKLIAQGTWDFFEAGRAKFISLNASKNDTKLKVKDKWFTSSIDFECISECGLYFSKAKLKKLKPSKVASLIRRLLNPTLIPPPYELATQAEALHKQLNVVDLHADPLLWGYDILRNDNNSHADLKRLLAGNIVIQGFGMATHIPLAPNPVFNTTFPDDLFFLSVTQKWPRRTWFSYFERGKFMADRLQFFADHSQDKLRVVKKSSDIKSILGLKASGKSIVGGVLGLEGAQAIEGDSYSEMYESLDILYEKGVRIVGLVHYVDNAYAGSFSGVRKYGLTEKGLWLVKEIERRQMLIDLSHASEQTVADVLELYDLGVLSRPLIYSHSGLFGHCPNVNLITDEQAKAVAAKGGVIGLAFFGRTLCGETVDDMVDAIEYGIKLVGEDHISLGTDFDGAISAPVDASGLGLITEELMERGFSEQQIRKIMGDNTLRVLTNYLP